MQFRKIQNKDSSIPGDHHRVIAEFQTISMVNTALIGVQFTSTSSLCGTLAGDLV